MAAAPPSEPVGAGKPISRRWAAIAFVATSVVTAGLSVGGSYATQALEARHADRKADYDRLVDLTGKMDGSAANFMTTYLLTAPVDAQGRPRTPLPLDATVLVAKRRSLEANLQEQDTALGEISIGFEGREAEDARRYRDRIGELYDALERPVAAQDGHDLVQALADAEGSRPALLAVLKRRARRF